MATIDYLVKFGQNCGAIFRENGSLSGNGNTTVEFLMPKSSFPQRFGQGFAPWGNYSKLQTLGKFPRVHPKDGTQTS